MKQIRLKNGLDVVIREAVKEDAQRMINFYNVVGGESDFLSFGENEFGMPLNDYESFIERMHAENNSIILLAEIENVLVSIASINSSAKNRIKHIGTLGIVISEHYCGMGLGKILMDALAEWAKSNGTTKKITLFTREDNKRAITLYEKLGYEQEGFLKKDTYLNGQYYNTLIMSMIFI